MELKDVSLQTIQDAKTRISDVVHKTPLELSRSASERIGSKTFLKYENSQLTGSFKIRGALNKILLLDDDQKSKGVIASSAGNHAQGVAYSAGKINVSSTIVMPTRTPLIKTVATRGYGAEVILYGEIYDQAYEYAKELSNKTGKIFVHPYQDPDVVSGQGTIALEILEDCKDLDTIVIPVGGGGLISGMAIALKTINPRIKVYGVQTQNAPNMTESYKRKKVSSYFPTISTIADGVAVKSPSPEMYKTFLSKYVDDMVLVSEDEIADSIVFLMERAKSIAEGAGALALAAALNGKFKLGQRTCLLVSGGNIDLNIIEKVVERGLRKSGRWTKVRVALEDRPGTLSKLAQCLGNLKANILQISQDRGLEGLLLGETSVDLTLETESWEHINDIKKELKEFGARLI